MSRVSIHKIHRRTNIWVPSICSSVDSSLPLHNRYARSLSLGLTQSLGLTTSSSLHARTGRVRRKAVATLGIRGDWKDTTNSAGLYRPLRSWGDKDYVRKLSKLPATVRRQFKLYRLGDLGIAARMKSDIQFITTPTSDTPGTALLLCFDDKRYIFGHVHEGLQRAGLQFGARFHKAKEIFLTGKTEWANTGGLLGMVLTLADGAIATAAAKAVNAQKKLARTKEIDEMATKSDANPGKGSMTPTSEGSSSGPTVAKDLPSLGIHGAPNIIHTLATARSFIFRQGLPIDVEEYSQVREAPENGDDLAPSFTDSRIQLWALPIRPTKNVMVSEASSPAPSRKRSLGDYMDGQRPTHQELLERFSPQLYPKRQDQEIRENIVSEMFKSNWSLDRLTEMPLSQVKLPAVLFVRDAETKALMRYTGPLPDGKVPVPDTSVLVREPWPGALVDHLPPTKPSPIAMSYIVRNHRLRGRFKPQEAKRLGVRPGPLFAKLSQGLTVVLENGSAVTPEMVLEPSKDGGGVAILDVPSKDYIPNLFNRSEWKMDRVMAGVGSFIWILGPGVVHDETLLKFMEEFKDMKHIVSSPDVCANSIMLTKAAAECERHRQIDPRRYNGLRHTEELSSTRTESTKSNEDKSPFIVARQGLQLQLEPSIAIDETQITDQLAEIHAQSQVPEEALRYAQEALADLRSEETQSELASQNLKSPDAKIICLGTGSALPSLERNVSASLLRVPGFGSYLLDCGENTLGQLQRMYSPAELRMILQDLKLIWISHLHADHHLGLASIIKAWHNAVHGNERVKKPKVNKEKLLADPEHFLKEGRRLYVVAHGQMAKWLEEYSTVEDFGYDQIMPLSTNPHLPYAASRSLLEWDGLDLGFHSSNPKL